MKKRYVILLIAFGIIIGLGISIKSGWHEKINAKEYFVEENPKSLSYKEMSRVFIDAAKNVQPATVYIYSEKKVQQYSQRNPMFEENDQFREFFGDEMLERFFGFGRQNRTPQQPVRALGSGVIVSSDGYIITNNHVVENAEKIKIQLDKNREYEAKLIGSDKKSDVAILKIDNVSDLPFAKLGDSDKLEVGEWIIAIGNPFGLTHTVTSGIVSAVGRNNMGISEYEDFIQTDCSINPGNSGGPMINLAGSVIGINTAIYSRSGGNQGIGFAIPINIIKKIMIDIIETGKVNRGYLGVLIGDVNEKIAKKFNLSKNQTGALISQVFKNSPADKGGIKEGDIVIEFNNIGVNDSGKLKNIVASTPINKKVPVKVIRDGIMKELFITIIEQPKNFDTMSADSGNEDLEDNSLGVTVQTLNTELAEKYGYAENQKGVIITSIQQNSIAAQYGLKKGDVILEIDRTSIRSVMDFSEALQKNEDSSILFKIQRRSQRLYLMIEK